MCFVWVLLMRPSFHLKLGILELPEFCPEQMLLNHHNTSKSVDFTCRDEAQAKMILLKERADKDLQQHNAEMKELVRILDHDRKLKEFMGIKGQERQEDAELTAWRKDKEQKDAVRKKETQENR